MSVRHRVEKLEGEEAKTKPVKFLFMEQRETREDCMKRLGYAPDDKSATFVMASWLDVDI